MKIELYNDGKGKWQSFEARCTTWDGCSTNIIEAYGATEKEAYDNLKKIAQEQINNLNNLIEKLERNEQQAKI
jgi:hypothetical protein